MTSILSLNTQNLLDSLYDIVYLVDLDGRIIFYNTERWNTFANRNDAPELTNELSITGKSIYDFITGDEVRDMYYSYSKYLIKKEIDEIIFPYKCDSPEVERDMRMAMTPVYENGAITGILYHSTVLHEKARPPLNILRRNKKKNKDQLPLLTICSYCKDVRIPADSTTGEWVKPEKYYQSGGTEDVALSHGVCPVCVTNLKVQIENLR